MRQEYKELKDTLINKKYENRKNEDRKTVKKIRKKIPFKHIG